MPAAYVLLNTEIGAETDVLKALKKVEGSKKPSTYGEFTT